MQIDADLPRPNVKPNYSEEEKIARDVARRRQDEADRRHRIFDAKRRMIGVDKQALDTQVLEKTQLKDLDKQLHGDHDKMSLNIDKQLKLLEIEKQRIKRDMEKEAKEFSLQNLHYEARREFDLNDPNAKKKGVPARIGDDDPRCGPASIQKFGGEDLMKRHREVQQQKAQASWVEQQIFEKTMAKQMEQDASDDFAAQVEGITQLRTEIEQKEEGLRKELQMAQQKANLHKAQEAGGIKKMGAVQDNVANAKEMEHHAIDPFLNETIEYHNANGRIKRDMYKGSNRTERIEVANLQKAQVDEKQNRKFSQMTGDAAFEAQTEMTRRQLVAMEREKQRTRRLMAEQMAQENRKAHQDQYDRQKHLSTNVYTNQPSDDFFGQFGTSTR
jgi:hypothetical protein